MIFCCSRLKWGTSPLSPINDNTPISDNTGAELPTGDRVRLAVAVWGDPVVSQTLVLLLRGSGYDVRLLPSSSLIKPELLKGVQLLLLTPTPELDTERREALTATLKDMQGAAGLLVLELVTSSEERQENEGRDETWLKVPWPLRSEELEQWIEDALLSTPGAQLKSYSDPPTWKQELEERSTRTARNTILGRGERS
jgi:hypothetical protein